MQRHIPACREQPAEEELTAWGRSQDQLDAESEHLGLETPDVVTQTHFPAGPPVFPSLLPYPT